MMKRSLRGIMVVIRSTVLTVAYASFCDPALPCAMMQWTLERINVTFGDLLDYGESSVGARTGHLR